MASSAISLTKQWIQQFIIKESICPFASVPFAKDQITYSLSTDKSFPESIQEVIGICMQMRSDPTINTAFYIMENDSYYFEDLLELNLACTEVLVDTDLDSDFQLVSFHPDFLFGGYLEDDPIHNTNRSPYPMLHILREDEVSRAVDSYGDTSNILQNNKVTTQRLFSK